MAFSYVDDISTIRSPKGAIINDIKLFMESKRAVAKIEKQSDSEEESKVVANRAFNSYRLAIARLGFKNIYCRMKDGEVYLVNDNEDVIDRLDGYGRTLFKIPNNPNPIK
jgi:adenylate cyclase class IV